MHWYTGRGRLSHMEVDAPPFPVLGKGSRRLPRGHVRLHVGTFSSGTSWDDKSCAKPFISCSRKSRNALVPRP